MYLNDHYGGAAFLSQFVQGGIPGVGGIEATLDLLGYTDDFIDVYHNWRIANLLQRDYGKYGYKTMDLDPATNPDLAGTGLKTLCEKLNIPPVLSFGTCTDTGRIADLLGAISYALGGVPIPDLPIVAVAPEYMEQKATIDAIFALAFGLYTYVNPVPTVTGAPNLVKLLTLDCKDLTGGILHIETDPVLNKFKEIVSPGIAPEVVSVSYIHCLLKGLHKAPRIGEQLQNTDVDYLVSPIGCWGRPHEAARKVGIPIIVKSDFLSTLILLSISGTQFQATSHVTI